MEEEEEHGARRQCGGGGGDLVGAAPGPADLLPLPPHTLSHPLTHHAAVGGIRDLGVSVETGEEGPRRRNLDLISALPEDLLLQVLHRLGCARAAARTSILSRPWRRLWTRLADFTFRDLPLDKLQAALDSLLLLAPEVSLLDVHLPEPEPDPELEDELVSFAPDGYADAVSSLLQSAAGLSPADLRLALHISSLPIYRVPADLPCFHRATNIDLRGPLDLDFSEPPSASFPALDSVTLSGCSFSITDLLLRCPHLRILRDIRDGLGSFGSVHRGDITIRSASLQELVLQIRQISTAIDIDAPMLQQLRVNIKADRDLRVSILAPMLEKVSWVCSYHRPRAGIGPWGLDVVTLESGVLRLKMQGYDWRSFPHNALILARELEKHLLTDFFVLDLRFTEWHAFGAFVSRLLGIQWVSASTRSLKITVTLMGEELKVCPITCPCDQPNNWRNQTISLINLEQVEITGLRGEDREVDLLRFILRCAPILTRITVRLSDEITTINAWCTEIKDIFKEYPLVQCNIELRSPLDIQSYAWL